jgi:hypothetical protein
MNIPKQATIPMIILLLFNFTVLSLTRVQKTPTIITLSKLQLFTITTAGNDAYTTARL